MVSGGDTASGVNHVPVEKEGGGGVGRFRKIFR